MQNRVIDIVREEKGNLVNISTIHSFCRWVLREDIVKLDKGYTQNFKSLEESDQKQIVKDLTQHIQSHNFPKPDEILIFY